MMIQQPRSDRQLNSKTKNRRMMTTRDSSIQSKARFYELRASMKVSLGRKFKIQPDCYILHLSAVLKAEGW